MTQRQDDCDRQTDIQTDKQRLDNMRTASESSACRQDTFIAALTDVKPSETLGACDKPDGVNADFRFLTKFDNKIKPAPRTMRFSAFYSLDQAPSNGVSRYSTCLIDSSQCRVDWSRLSFFRMTPHLNNNFCSIHQLR